MNINERETILEQARELCLKEDVESAKEFIELLKCCTYEVYNSDPKGWDEFNNMMINRITFNPTNSDFNKYLYNYILKNI